MAKKKQPSVSLSQAKTATWQDVVVLGIAAKEGWEILTPGQYEHMKDLEKQLVGFGRRDFDSNLRIEQIGEFWELKDKGGTLGRKNMRVYFAFDTECNDVVILATYKKEEDGSPSQNLKIRIRNRWRKYKEGHFSDQLIRYSRPET